MNLNYQKLSNSEINEFLLKFSDWEFKISSISKKFTFLDYSSGVLFAASIGYIANQLNHHPDLKIGYRTLEVTTSTHDVQGITTYDLEFIDRIEAFYSLNTSDS